VNHVGVKRLLKTIMFSLALVGAFIAFSSWARAAEIRLSSPDAISEGVELSGVWAAWDDYSVDPAVVRWRNLETGAQGTVEVPGMGYRTGTWWSIGSGLLVWESWVDGEYAGLWTQDLLSGERRSLTTDVLADQDLKLKGSFLYQLGEGVLRRLDLKSGVTKTFATSASVSGYWNVWDVDGDWLAWTDFGESPSDVGALGTVHLWNLATKQETILGSVFWGNSQDTPPEVNVSGRWVTWNTDKSFEEWDDTSAFAYNLETRELGTLEQRMGAEQDPHGVHASGDWIAWTDVRGGDNVRGFVMDLSDPSALPIPVAKTPGWQYWTSLDSSWLVWSDDRSGDYSLYARRVDDMLAEAFSDVSVSPYKVAIESLAAGNVIGGYGDGTFRPGNPVLRAQFAKMIVLSLGVSTWETPIDMPFTDVEQPEDSLYPDDYVTAAAYHGLIQGYGGGLFRPYVDITRAQLLTIVVRAAQQFKPAALQEPPAGWHGVLAADDPTHGANIARAEYSGLLGGIDLGTFAVWGKATRGEIAQILWTLREK
jgi:hypothetical protein